MSDRDGFEPTGDATGDQLPTGRDVRRAERHTANTRRGRIARRKGAGAGDRRRRDRGLLVRRLVGLAVLAGGVVGGGIVARTPTGETLAPTFGRLVEPPMPILRSDAALGATWFCPGVPAGADGVDGAVVLANTSDLPVEARVTVTPAVGGPAPVVETVTVRERERLELHVRDVVTAPFAAVQVESLSGALTVEALSYGKLDERASQVVSQGPCATAPSRTWYFADGATTTEANETLLVYNPFPDDAVVDLVFADDAGVRRPPRFQGLPVKRRSLVAIAVGDTIQRKEQVSVALSATVGRVVLGRYQLYTTKPRRTLVAGLATPSPGRQWTFADVERVAGDGPGSVSTVFALYNPSADPATVTVSLLPAAGVSSVAALDPAAVDPAAVDPAATDPAAVPAETDHTEPTGPDTTPGTSGGGVNVLSFTVEVAGGSNALFPLDQVPDGRYSALVTSTTPVVAERQLLRVGDPRVVTTVQFGSRMAARRWAFATTAPAGWSAALVIANPSPSPATVTVSSLSAAGLQPVAGMDAVSIPATGSTRLDLGPAGIGTAAVLVDASTEIVVERLAEPAPDQPGSTASLGIPVVAG